MFDLLKSKVREFTVYAAARTILFAFFYSSVLSRITTKRFELLLRDKSSSHVFFFLVCLLQKLLKVHLPCHIVVVHETPT